MPRVERSSGSSLRMYQLATSAWPSGLACVASRMTSSRKRMVSASSRLTKGGKACGHGVPRRFGLQLWGCLAVVE